MQDEVNTKVVAVAIRGGKITGQMLGKALKKLLAEMEQAQKTSSQPKTYRGKQSIKRLVEQNAAISNIEVTDGKETLREIVKSSAEDEAEFKQLVEESIASQQEGHDGVHRQLQARLLSLCS